MMFSKWKSILVLLVLFLVALVIFGARFIVNNFESSTNNKIMVNNNEAFGNNIGRTPAKIDETETKDDSPENLPSENTPLKTDPETKSETSNLANPSPIIKGVYVTSWSALSKSYIAYMDQLFKSTQINAVVVDIKDFSGVVFYDSKAEGVQKYKTFKKDLIDIDNFVRHFHDQGVYVIARINVFNDTALAKERPDLALYDKLQSGESNKVFWKDYSGLYWLDPASKEVWDYNIEIARDLLDRGFDEINFDYIRFPSDGNLETIGYPVFKKEKLRQEIIKDFFKKLRESLPEAKLSIDIFGQTTTTVYGDMGVGQVFEDTLGYFDYVCPMVYPSHYVSGFLGYENPAEHPYEMVKYALDGAVSKKTAYELANPEVKTAKIRPWIQDFDLGAIYGDNEVFQETKATEDSLKETFNGFLLWNPSNYYSTKSILKDN